MQAEQQSDLNQIMPLFSPIYDEQYLKNAAKILQAIKNKEFTQEMNKLSQHILSQQAGDYNCWYIKKMYVLSQDKSEELYHREQSFVDQCLKSKVKGFQVWEHKRFLNQHFGLGLQEQLKKVQKVLLQKDQKNYHAWSYRVWLVNFGNIYEKEIDFAMKMIKKDAYNNSAWNHLYFVLQNIAIKMQKEERLKFLNKYVNMTLQNIQQWKGNRASWNFLRGLFPSIKLKNIPNKNETKQILVDSYDQYPHIYEYCQQQWKKTQQQKQSQKQQINQAEQIQILTTMIHIHSQKEQNSEYVQNICQQLKIKEPLRRFYWEWVKNGIK